MNTVKKIYPLLLFLTAFILMSMTEDEKRKFIENLAETSTQKKVFYRWQSQKVHDNLLRVGEMTPKLYRHFMDMNDPWAGAGLYVAEDVLSSRQFGNSLVQVEIEPGYKYLNLLDNSVQQKLESVGLTNEDVYRLNPKIAVTDIKENQPYWVLKGQKGIKFKPFSPRFIPFNQLAQLYHFRKPRPLDTTILTEVYRRAKKDLPSVVASKFIHILEKKHGRRAIQKAVDDRFRALKNIDDSMALFRHAKNYINLDEVIRQSIPLIRSSQDGINFLDEAKDHLSPAKQKKIIAQSIDLMQTSTDGVNLIRWLDIHGEPLERKEIIAKSIALMKTSTDGMNLLYWAFQHLEPLERKEIIAQSIALMKTSKDGANLIRWVDEHLEPLERKEIFAKSIASIKTLTEGIDLLELSLPYDYLQQGDINQIARKILKLDEKTGKEHLKLLLSQTEYKEALTQFKRYKKTRLNCLIKQLSSLSL